MATSEAKDERIDFRTTNQVKEVIQRAADLMGTTMSSFVAQRSYEAAVELLSAHESLVLSGRDRDTFLSLVDAPPEPNDALRALLQSE